MKKIVTLFIFILLILLFVGAIGDGRYAYINTAEENQKNLAALFFTQTINPTTLQNKYANAKRTGSKINLLVMPGHEPGEGGAEYRGLREREMAVELAGYLNEYLKNNPRYNVITARTNTAWNPDLETYFNQNWNQIKNFAQTQGEIMSELVSNGKVTRIDNGAYHVNAPQDAAIRLYGINKWSNEHNIDIALHIHFNDYPRKAQSSPGQYSGFTIFIPEKQYSNAQGTRPIADAIFKRLSKIFPVSDYPAESKGVVEEQELIAIGTRNTADAASMLVEYGYLYEPQFQNDEVRHAVLREMALQTYLGLQDFFAGGNDTGLVYQTTLLPEKWKTEITKNTEDPIQVLSLQTALMLQGFYPANNDSKNDCPLSGHIGPCTLASLGDFQEAFKIQGEKGKVGKKTISTLNSVYKLLP